MASFPFWLWILLALMAVAYIFFLLIVFVVRRKDKKKQPIGSLSISHFFRFSGNASRQLCTFGYPVMLFCLKAQQTQHPVLTELAVLVSPRDLAKNYVPLAFFAFLFIKRLGKCQVVSSEIALEAVAIFLLRNGVFISMVYFPN